MANTEHLAILKQGVEVWNRWRERHPKATPDLSEANLSQMELRQGNFHKVILSGANLSAASLRKADLSDSDLIRVNLTGADLYSADLSSARLGGANLIKAQLGAASLKRAQLPKANLSEATLWDANLNGANLASAHLSKAELISTDFDGADLTGANLGGASLLGTIFGDLDLSQIRGLDRVIHLGPSTIGINTIYRSGGKIPESFLRGAGVPEDFITYMRSLTTKAFEFYSAFISYSSKNQDIADRIYADLQARAVRCWLATEDLKIGDRFRQRIDESIRLHDKLLLILSGYSVQSEWVEQEVEAAFERERQDKRDVLFPIRIDNAVMDTTAAWAASIRRTRHIGDFTRWKDHDAYGKAPERLLRGLKDESKARDIEAGR